MQYARPFSGRSESHSTTQVTDPKGTALPCQIPVSSLTHTCRSSTEQLWHNRANALPPKQVTAPPTLHGPARKILDSGRPCPQYDNQREHHATPDHFRTPLLSPSRQSTRAPASTRHSNLPSGRFPTSAISLQQRFHPFTRNTILTSRQLAPALEQKQHSVRGSIGIIRQTTGLDFSTDRVRRRTAERGILPTRSPGLPTNPDQPADPDHAAPSRSSRGNYANCWWSSRPRARRFTRSTVPASSPDHPVAGDGDQ